MPRRRRSWPSTIRRLLCDVVTLVRLALTPRAQLAAENLFLRKQLALYQERCVKPRRPDPATRVILVLLSRLLDWRSILTVVKPDTLIRWHRQGWRLFWRWKSRPGRPPIPRDLQRLIVRMAQANPTWGEERIANELRLKLGLIVSPRTVGRYLRTLRPRRGGSRSQRWATFVRNHAHAVVACDFFTTVTVGFRILYVFVVLEVGTRRILHWNVTDASHGGVDDPAVPRGHHPRDVPPVRPPRSRQHLFGHGRPSDRVDGAACAQDARADTAGQCVLRTIDRHDASGVSGLADPDSRGPSPTDPSRMGAPL